MTIDNLKKQVEEKIGEILDFHKMSHITKEVVKTFILSTIDTSYNQGYEDGVRKTVEEVNEIILCHDPMEQTIVIRKQDWQQLKDKLLVKK